MDLCFGRVDLFSWTTGSVFMDMWVFQTGIYRDENGKVVARTQGMEPNVPTKGSENKYKFSGNKLTYVTSEGETDELLVEPNGIKVEGYIFVPVKDIFSKDLNGTPLNKRN